MMLHLPLFPCCEKSTCASQCDILPNRPQFYKTLSSQPFAATGLVLNAPNPALGIPFAKPSFLKVEVPAREPWSPQALSPGFALGPAKPRTSSPCATDTPALS